MLQMGGLEGKAIHGILYGKLLESGYAGEAKVGDKV